MDEIPTTTLEGLCELVVDCPHFTPAWTEHGRLVIRNQNIRDGRLDLSQPSFTHDADFDRRIRRAKPREGDIIFTREAPMGEVCMIPPGLECCVGQRQVLLRPAPNVDGRYLFYALQSPYVRHQIFWNEGTGSTVSNVRIPVLKALKIPRLGEDERSVADVLEALDQKIGLNRRMNETLEATARAIFKDWFVDFGPTRAKVEGREPYLSPELWDLFPDAVDDEDKPVGWETSAIGKEVDAVGGATPSTKEPAYWNEGDHPWATPKDLSKLSSPVLLHTDRRITDAGVRKISSGLLPVGTVLLSSRAPIGYLAITEVATAVNQGFIAMVCAKRLPNTFVLFWCYENLDYIKGISGGSTFAEISKRAFRPIPVIVPSQRTITVYEGLVRPLYDRIVANAKESSSLVRTRDLLLPKLMSGEIRLRDAENAVEAVA